MAEGQPGPVLPELRWTLYVVAVLVFLVGIPLIQLAGKTDDYFAWTIHPSLEDPLFGHVVIFAPTGRVDASHVALPGTAILVGTFPGGTCKVDHNTPEVACMLF